MKENWLSSLKHVFKLDPNKKLTDDQIKRLCQSGTDSIMIGGTLGVTYEDTQDLLRSVRKYGTFPIIQEISNLESIVPGFDLYFIPLVLNAQDPQWILNAHHQAIMKHGELISWDQVYIEGYIVLNQDSSVAKLTKSKTDLDEDEVIAYARMNDRMLKLPILYIEYSGTFGNVNLLREIKGEVVHSKVFYGGGITSRASAEEMKKFADTVIVGNLIYDDFELALETVIK